LAQVGGNYIRLWLGPLGAKTLQLETVVTGLGNYSQEAAFRLDYLLELALDYQIYVMFTLNSYNELRSHLYYPAWAENPYNVINGGPCDKPLDFLTQTNAIDIMKQRHRYIIARYASFVNLFSWEYWNEVDGIQTYEKPVVLAWHTMMINYTAHIDPSQHMRTTSFAHPSVFNTQIFGLSGISYGQIHQYTWSDIFNQTIVGCRQLMSDIDKPAFYAEFGIGSSQLSNALDPTGISLSHALWSSMIGCPGGSMTWWWDTYVSPRNLYTRWAPVKYVSSLFNDKRGLLDLLPAQCSHVGINVYAAYDNKTHIVVYLHNSNYTWDKVADHIDLSPIVDATVSLFQLPPNMCINITWTNTANASSPIRIVQKTTTSQGRLDTEAPTFETDLIALISWKYIQGQPDCKPSTVSFTV